MDNDVSLSILAVLVYEPHNSIPPCRSALARFEDYFDIPYGRLLESSDKQASLWWASSGWKISRTRHLPKTSSRTILISAARNEAEAAQLIIRPKKSLRSFIAYAGPMTGPGGAIIPAQNIDVLRVRYLQVPYTSSLPFSKVVGPNDCNLAAPDWPDPLPPFKNTIELQAGKNQPECIELIG